MNSPQESDFADVVAALLRGRAECLGVLRYAAAGRPVSDRDIEQALDAAIWPGGRRATLFHEAPRGGGVCLVVSDHTRETGADRILPPILERLHRAGFGLPDINVLIACGIHRPPTAVEISRILGPELADRFKGRIFPHNADEPAGLEEVGRTRRGNVVRLNRIYVRAALRVAVGAASFHYHAGFGGGRKSIVPGLASRDIIAASHSLALDFARRAMHPAARAGVLDGNPVAEEILESARLCPPHAVVNTVFAPNHEMAAVFAGDMEAAHAAAVEAVRKNCAVRLEERADFAVADAGNASNWIQAHKALVNAHAAVHEKHGRVVLLAPCSEGLGDEQFRLWLKAPTLEELFARLRREPAVLGQTAFSTRTRGRRAILITQMPPKDAADLGIMTAPDLASAVEQTLLELGRAGITRPSCYIMPQAKNLFPFVAECP